MPAPPSPLLNIVSLRETVSKVKICQHKHARCLFEMHSASFDSASLQIKPPSCIKYKSMLRLPLVQMRVPTGVSIFRVVCNQLNNQHTGARDFS